MRIKKLVLGILLTSGLLLSSTAFSTSAFADSVVVDNDSKTYTNAHDGSWTPLSSGNYGDSEIHYNNDPNAYYYWIFSQSLHTGYWQMKVYLSNSAFTNTLTEYDKNGSAQFYYNQNSAPYGWSTTISEYLSTGTKYTFAVRGMAANDYSQDTGADSIGFDW